MKKIQLVLSLLVLSLLFLPAVYALTRTIDSYESGNFTVPPWSAATGSGGSQAVTTSASYVKEGTHGAIMKASFVPISMLAAPISGDAGDWNAWIKSDDGLNTSQPAYWVADQATVGPANYIRCFRYYGGGGGIWKVGTKDENILFGHTQLDASRWISCQIIYTSGATTYQAILRDTNTGSNILGTVNGSLISGFTVNYILTSNEATSNDRWGEFDVVQYGGIADVVTTCTYSGSGDWNVSLADNCNLTTDTNIGANKFYTSGVGSLTINAWIQASEAHLIGTNIHWMGKGFK